MPITVNRLTLELQTLTPLWLGDTDRDSATAKESGLVGSLRFWFEGLMRSCGQTVCDTIGNGCTGNDLCEVCKVFGTTDSARRFRLEIEGLSAVPLFFRMSPKVARSSGDWLWKTFGEKSTGGSKTILPDRSVRYQFGVQALWSDRPFQVHIYPRGLPDSAEQTKMLLATIFEIASRRGGLGAKTQNGFGQMKLIPNGELPQLIGGAESYLKRLSRNSGTTQNGYFTLASQRFFSHRYRIDGSKYDKAQDVGMRPPRFKDQYIPCSFDIRYKCESYNPRSGQGTDRGLRPAVRDEMGDTAAREVFGYVEGSEARASRVHVSHLYRESDSGPYFLKVWGDVERKAQVEKIIQQHLMTRFGASAPEKL